MPSEAGKEIANGAGKLLHITNRNRTRANNNS